ncbi:MAG: flavodoxin-dependent (E)-4-hydroxy-3-methylbut-2-enyl-diphosphate synthase, partial [Alistipes inops]
YGDTPEGMVESAMEYLRICRREGFDRVVISMKSSNTRVMVHAYRMLVAAMHLEGMDYPLHLGVTEAGSGLEGRIKSAVGIGALLADGVGDTIRVSLTEPPENEIPAAQAIRPTSRPQLHRGVSQGRGPAGTVRLFAPPYRIRRLDGGDNPRRSNWPQNRRPARRTHCRHRGRGTASRRGVARGDSPHGRRRRPPSGHPQAYLSVL